MKFSFNSFKNVLFGSRKGKEIVISQLVNPVREWTIGLMLASTLFIAIAAYSGYQFYSQYNLTDPLKEEYAGLRLYRENDVKEVLELYRNKEIQFIKLRQDRSKAVTPIVIDEELVSTSTAEPEEIPLAEESTTE